MQASNTWTWAVCNLPLRQAIQGEVGNHVIWSLKPSITLLHPKIEGPKPTINLHVESEKSLQFSEEGGWKWHKSWKLPSVSLKFELIDPDTHDLLLCPNDIFAHIFAVKVSLDENKKPCLTDVGLKGNNKVELVDGKGTFQTLKFSSTSYNNEGLKFHLLICLYLHVSEDTQPKILKAIISPAIFVDSRKTVKDSEKIRENKLYIYSNPFSPDDFTKRFVKKETKKKESFEEDIQNNIDGLYSYLTAPNIRNKVKHPIFLSIRFANCISFYYNPHDLNPQMEPNYSEKLQDLLFRDIERYGNFKEVRPEESAFLMCIDIQPLEDRNKKKKISESLNAVRCRSLSVVFSKNEVPENFIQFHDLDSMMEWYSKCYSKLAKKSKSFLQDDDNEEEEGPTEKLPPPERQIINFQEHKALKRDYWQSYLDSHVSHELLQKKVKTEVNSSPPRTIVERAPSSMSDRGVSPYTRVEQFNALDLLNKNTFSPHPLGKPGFFFDSQSPAFLNFIQGSLGYTGNFSPKVLPRTNLVTNTTGLGCLNTFTSLSQDIKSANQKQSMVELSEGPLSEGKEKKPFGMQGFRRFSFEKENVEDIPFHPIISIPRNKDSAINKYQKKPVLLQWQGCSLEDGLRINHPLQKEIKPKFESDISSNEIKVKNEEPGNDK